MTETYILTINRPEDKSRLLELVQKLGIVFAQKKPRKPLAARRKIPVVNRGQPQVFERMEQLRLEFLEKYRIPEQLDINHLIDQMNTQ